MILSCVYIVPVLMVLYYTVHVLLGDIVVCVHSTCTCDAELYMLVLLGDIVVCVHSTCTNGALLYCTCTFR